MGNAIVNTMHQDGPKVFFSWHCSPTLLWTSFLCCWNMSLYRNYSMFYLYWLF